MGKKLVAAAVLCLIAAPAFARSVDPLREIGSRIRDRVIRLVRVVTLGDNLQPPLPKP